MCFRNKNVILSWFKQYFIQINLHADKYIQCQCLSPSICKCGLFRKCFFKTIHGRVGLGEAWQKRIFGNSKKPTGLLVGTDGWSDGLLRQTSTDNELEVFQENETCFKEGYLQPGNHQVSISFNETSKDKLSNWLSIIVRCMPNYTKTFHFYMLITLKHKKVFEKFVTVLW